SVRLGAGAGSPAIGSAIIMAGSPRAMAGHAAAIDETVYDLGGALGVAVLGSVASVAYRIHLDTAALTGPALDSGQVRAAEESLGAALEIASRTGAAELAARARDAFTDCLPQPGPAGGPVMLAAAAVVFVLVPRDLDLTDQHH